jgi:CO dehydrogenase maturation factor
MKTIAIAGKGGTGKSTLAALLVRRLSESRAGSVLAVDADSNVNLNDLLGVPLKETVGAIREEMRARVSQLPGGMTKQQFLEYKIQTSLVEGPDFDLLAMGRPEGPGCYCYANNLLQDILRTLSANYDYIVIDNEAGMEHLSRRTSQAIDHLLIVSDATTRGIATAGKISRLLGELEARVGRKHLVLNRVAGPLFDSVEAAIRKENFTLLETVPEDETLLKMDQQGIPVYSVSADSPAYRSVGRMMERLDLQGS